MKTKDFRPQVTSFKLKENIAKQFGKQVNLEKYNREQLEDMRNKLRTRVFHYEGAKGFNDLLHNESYQQDKAMLELLNTRIKEMLGEDIKKLRDKMVELSEGKKGVKVAKHPQGSKKATKDYDGDGKVEAPKDEVWGSRAKAAAKAGKPFKESAKPDFLDLDKDGNKTEPMKKAAKEKKMKEGWDDMEKAVKSRAHDTGGMKPGDTKPSSTGGTITKTKTGLKHSAGKQYGGSDAPATPDSDKKLMKSKKVKESEEKCDECGMWESKCTCVHEGKDEGKPGKNFAKIAKKAGEKYGSKAAGERVAGAVRAKLAKQGKLEESSQAIFKRHVRIVNESLAVLLAEDEEGKAKAITAAGDMVNDFTSWMQRVGQFQTKTMIELADAIKADFGAQEAETFKASVGPALSSTLEALTQQREAVSNAVAVLAGEATPEAPMGMEPEMGPEEPGMDTAEPDMMNPEPAGDEFAASDAAAGGPEAAGRAMRESKEQRKARKLAEAHSVMAKLAR